MLIYHVKVSGIPSGIEFIKTIRYPRGGSRISKGGVDGRPYLLRGARENALTKKIGNNFSCTCLRRVF